MATYAISIACVLWRRRALPDSIPPTKWTLGQWGVAVNAIGLIYAIYSFFWAFWPIYWKPTPEEVSNYYYSYCFCSVLLLAIRRRDKKTS